MDGIKGANGDEKKVFLKVASKLKVTFFPENLGHLFGLLQKDDGI